MLTAAAVYLFHLFLQQNINSVIDHMRFFWSLWFFVAPQTKQEASCFCHVNCIQTQVSSFVQHHDWLVHCSLETNQDSS